MDLHAGRGRAVSTVTRGLLAGAYKGGRKSLAVLLTHSTQDESKKTKQHRAPDGTLIDKDGFIIEPGHPQEGVPWSSSKGSMVNGAQLSAQLRAAAEAEGLSLEDFLGRRRATHAPPFKLEPERVRTLRGSVNPLTGAGAAYLLKLPAELHKRVQKAAKAEGVSLAEWWRRAGEMALAQYKPKGSKR